MAAVVLSIADAKHLLLLASTAAAVLVSLAAAPPPAPVPVPAPPPAPVPVPAPPPAPVPVPAPPPVPVPVPAPPPPSPGGNDETRTVRLHMYMHDVVGPTGQTSVRINKGGGPMNPSLQPGHLFGETYAFDDPLTEGTSRRSSSAGRARGTYMLSSLRRPVWLVDMVMQLTSGEYRGSTLAVEGLDDADQDTRELAVTGGTGRLRLASGTVRCRTAREVSKFHTVYELDVNATVPEDEDEDDTPEPPGRRRRQQLNGAN